MISFIITGVIDNKYENKLRPSGRGICLIPLTSFQFLLIPFLLPVSGVGCL